MALTIRKHLLRLLALHLSNVSLLWPPFAVHHWPLYQMDVKNAFLNKDFQEEVYMQPPPGYTYPGHQVVTFVVLFMASSKLLGLGLKSLAQLLLSKVSLRVLMTLLSSSKDPLLVSLVFFFMLITWLLLEMTLQVSALYNTSSVNILRWKI